MHPSPAAHAPEPRRYLGLGLVVALHLAGIYALSAGLIRPPAKPREIASVKVLPPEVREQPPVEQPRVPQPHLPTVQPIPVPVPAFELAHAPEAPVTTAPMQAVDAAPTAPAGPVRPAAVQPQVAQPPVRSAGAVCAVMPRPEVPAVGWSGEAVLQVIATVRGGRVVGSEFRVTQGALDGKTRRALQRAVESALAGYQCQGDAMFQQDFAFTLD